MDNRNNILFVFEGEKTELQILNSLRLFFLDTNTVITCAFCSTIYQIYSQISEDEDLDTFNLLKKREKNKEILKEFKSSDFAEIYLFFDYDGHDIIADDGKIIDLLNFFSEETDKGKLYLSYPMIESLKHIQDYDAFENLKVKCKENINYKKVVSDCCLNELKNFTIYSEILWKKLLKIHLSKMNKIVSDSFTLPSNLIYQNEIFENQLKKYINVDSTVAVLNSFPAFIHDYYGNKYLVDLLND